jgi:hypothetical protein
VSGPPIAKGGRPTFLQDAAVDDLTSMVMALAQELAVLRERCDTTERLLTGAQVLAPGAVEDYRAPREVDAEREAWRRSYLERVLYPLKARAARAAGAEEAYASVVKDVGQD